MTQALERTRNWLESPVTNRVFQIIAVVSLLIGLSVGVRQYQLTSCLATYNETTSQSTLLRSAAAEADRKAVDDMVRAIAEARRAPDPAAAVDKALSGYLQARAFTDGQREGKPLPAPPSQTCG